MPPTAVQVERTIALSGTILDNTIPMCYGTATVRGLIGAWEYDDSAKVLDLGIVFAPGEQGSIATATTYMNGEAITSVTGVTNEAVHVGDGSAALSAILTGMNEWNGANDTALWKSHAHAVIRINCRTSQLPGSFVFTSKLGGRKVAPIGGGGAAVSLNPATIGYDIMTSSDWAGVAAARINETSWGLFKTWCGEAMGDGTDRYEWNGVLTERDPDRALAIVLGQGLGQTYIGADGKLAIWAEMAPPAITGEWSASASDTITEDSTAGNAVAELDVGDYVYAGTNLRRVVTITDDDTVVLDSAVTVSGVRVRPISNVYIKKRDWVQPPAATESNLLQTPDKYRVRFVDEDNAGSHEVTVQYGGGTDKIVEAVLPGSASASVTTRHAKTTLLVAHLQPYSWTGPVGNDIGTALEPGDVLLFDDDVLTMQAARVVAPPQARADGTYVLQLREFDPSAYSDDTAVTDTVPNLGTGYASNKPPVVTQIHTSYSGTTYDLVGMGSAGIYAGRVVLGDTGRDTVLGSDDIRLPYEVPIYGLKSGGATVEMFQMGSAGGSSDQLIIGDGSESIFFNGTNFIFPYSTNIKAGWTGKRTFIALSAAGAPTFGYASADVTIAGLGIKLDAGGQTARYMGLLSGAGSAPTTGDLPNDLDFCIWEETDTHNHSWFINDATTIRQFTAKS